MSDRIADNVESRSENLDLKVVVHIHDERAGLVSGDLKVAFAVDGDIPCALAEILVVGQPAVPVEPYARAVRQGVGADVVGRSDEHGLPFGNHIHSRDCRASYEYRHGCDGGDTVT